MEVLEERLVLRLQLAEAGLDDVADGDDPGEQSVAIDTGRWRIRRSVIETISSSTESSAAHVTTSADIADAIVRPSALDPWAASARTTSRSETMPSMCRPSAETTSAPTPMVTQLGCGVGERGLLGDGGDVGSLAGEDRLNVHRGTQRLAPCQSSRRVSPLTHRCG